MRVWNRLIAGVSAAALLVGSACSSRPPSDDLASERSETAKAPSTARSSNEPTRSKQREADEDETNRDEAKPSEKPVVTGRIVWQGSEAPKGAVARVKLMDVSEGRAAAVPVQSTSVAGLHKSPVSFELPYDRDTIDASGRYLVEARATKGGSLVAVGRKAQPVIPDGQGQKVELVLEPIESAASD